MEIQRINSYVDKRFSEKVLLQHGCFLADDIPYEVEIISDHEAIIRGENKHIYQEIIENFRFFTPHIRKFYNMDGQLVREYPQEQLLNICLDEIQPSQFFIDEDKIDAVSTFIQKSQDIIIQVLRFEGRYISLDGHTRLYYAAMKEWSVVRAVVIEALDEWAIRFAEEARKRKIFTPKDMVMVCHSEYEEKWNRFCDDFLAAGEE